MFIYKHFEFYISEHFICELRIVYSRDCEIKFSLRNFKSGSFNIEETLVQLFNRYVTDEILQEYTDLVENNIVDISLSETLI